MSLLEEGTQCYKLYTPQSRLKFLLYSSKRDFLLMGECRRYEHKSKVNAGDTHTFTLLAQLVTSCWLFQGGWSFPRAIPWSEVLYCGLPGPPTNGERGKIPAWLERREHQGKVKSIFFLLCSSFSHIFLLFSEWHKIMSCPMKGGELLHIAATTHHSRQCRLLDT